MQETAENRRSDEKMPVERPWKQQPGESRLWYNRFCLYMSLGPKRTVQAAVEKERQSIRALKSTDEATSRPKKGQRSRKKSPTHLEALPAPAQKPVQVPGSWKAACKQWNWVERARAKDQKLIEATVEKHLQELIQDGHAFPFQRVKVLDVMLDALIKMFNAANNRMNFTEYTMVMGRMQSIMRDIREEMEQYDETVTRVVLEQHYARAMRELSRDELKDVY